MSTIGCTTGCRDDGFEASAVVTGKSVDRHVVAADSSKFFLLVAWSRLERPNGMRKFGILGCFIAKEKHGQSIRLGIWSALFGTLVCVVVDGLQYAAIKKKEHMKIRWTVPRNWQL